MRDSLSYTERVIVSFANYVGVDTANKSAAVIIHSGLVVLPMLLILKACSSMLGRCVVWGGRGTENFSFNDWMTLSITEHDLTDYARDLSTLINLERRN